MTRDTLRIKIQKLDLGKADEELAGEILAETPEDELETLATVIADREALRTLIRNYREEAVGEKEENIFEGAPDLIGHAVSDEDTQEPA